MKKFIAMLLALVMVLSLVACGDKKEDAGTNDSDKDSQDTITLKMHFVDPETAPFVQGGKKIAELVSEATDGRSRSRFSPAVPSAASATRSSSRWTTAWISPPARTPC